MALGLVPIAHATGAVFAIVELGLTAHVASVFDGWLSGLGGGSYTPAIIDFIIFSSIWSLLVLAYVGLSPVYLTGCFNELAALVLSVITTIFWFSAAIALAVWVGGPYSCRGRLCADAEAAVAFAFLLWAVFTFLAVLHILEALRRRGRNTPAAPKPSSAAW